jgi:sugar phosphate permease
MTVMWLPFYLHSEIGLSASHADVLSNLYDVGSIIGSVIAGYASDRLQKRIPIVVLLCFLSMGSIMLFDTLQPKSSTDDSQQTSDWYLSFIMFLTGFVLGGPTNLVPSTCVSDLCNSSKQLQASTGAIVGFVDGFGTIGGALGPSIVAYVFTHYSWSAVFVVFVVGLCLAIASLSKMCIKEIKELLNIHAQNSHHHHHRTSTSTSTPIAYEAAQNGVA